MKSVKIDSTSMDYVQHLYYEMLGLELIFKNILLKNKKSTDYEYRKENVDYYIEELKKCSVKFNTIKNEIVTQYCPSWIDKDVSFDFISCEIKLNDKGCDIYV